MKRNSVSQITRKVTALSLSAIISIGSMQCDGLYFSAFAEDENQSYGDGTLGASDENQSAVSYKFDYDDSQLIAVIGRDNSAGAQRQTPIDGVILGSTTLGELKAMYSEIDFTDVTLENWSEASFTADDFIIKPYIQLGTTAGTFEYWLQSDDIVMNISSMEYADSCIVHNIGFQLFVDGDAIAASELSWGDVIYFNYDTIKPVYEIDVSEHLNGTYSKSQSSNAFNMPLIILEEFAGKTLGEIKSSYSGINVVGYDKLNMSIEADVLEAQYWMLLDNGEWFYNWGSLIDLYNLKTFNSLSEEATNALSISEFKYSPIIEHNDSNVTSIYVTNGEPVCLAYDYDGSQLFAMVKNDGCAIAGRKVYPENVTFGTTTLGELKTMYKSISFEDVSVTNSSVESLALDKFDIHAYIQLGTTSTTFEHWVNMDGKTLDLSTLDGYSDSCVVHDIGFEIGIAAEDVKAAGLGLDDLIYINYETLKPVYKIDISDTFNGLFFNSNNDYGEKAVTVTSLTGKTLGELKEEYAGILVTGFADLYASEYIDFFGAEYSINFDNGYLYSWGPLIDFYYLKSVSGLSEEATNALTITECKYTPIIGTYDSTRVGMVAIWNKEKMYHNMGSSVGIYWQKYDGATSYTVTIGETAPLTATAYIEFINPWQLLFEGQYPTGTYTVTITANKNDGSTAEVASFDIEHEYYPIMASADVENSILTVNWAYENPKIKSYNVIVSGSDSNYYKYISFEADTTSASLELPDDISYPVCVSIDAVLSCEDSGNITITKRLYAIPYDSPMGYDTGLYWPADKDAVKYKTFVSWENGEICREHIENRDVSILNQMREECPFGTHTIIISSIAADGTEKVISTFDCVYVGPEFPEDIVIPEDIEPYMAGNALFWTAIDGVSGYTVSATNGDTTIVDECFMNQSASITSKIADFPSGTYTLTISAVAENGAKKVIGTYEYEHTQILSVCIVDGALVWPDFYGVDYYTVSATDGTSVVTDTCFLNNSYGIFNMISGFPSGTYTLTVNAVSTDGTKTRVGTYDYEHVSANVDTDSGIEIDEIAITDNVLRWPSVNEADHYIVTMTSGNSVTTDYCFANDSTNFISAMDYAKFESGTVAIEIKAVFKDLTEKIVGNISYEYIAPEISETGGENTFKYVDNEDGTSVTITGGTINNGDVVIPAEIDGKAVTHIAANAFDFEMGIKTLVISEGVKEIGWYAFNTCSNLTSVTLPESLEVIDMWAFERCYALKTVTIPSNVKEIRDGAFAQNSSMTEIIVAPDNNYYMSYGGVVYTKDESALVAYPAGKKGDYIVNTNTRYISNAAFYGCRGLTGITFRGSLSFIGFEAFAECESLTSIEIADGVDYVGYSAFRNCIGIKNITVPASVVNIGNEAFGYINNAYEYEGTSYSGTKISGFSLTGYENSAIHLYAQRHEIPFIIITPEEGEEVEIATPFDNVTPTEEAVEGFEEMTEEEQDESIEKVEVTPPSEIWDKNELGKKIEGEIKVNAKPHKNDEIRNKLKEELKIGDGECLDLIDISLTADGKDISEEYDGLMRVRIKVPKNHKNKGNKFHCYRIKDDGKKEHIPGNIEKDSEGNEWFIMYLEHFSVYAITNTEGIENGYTMTGVVTSFGDDKSGVTVSLLDGNGTEVYSAVTGVDGTYKFTVIPAGIYTLSLSKESHVTREYTVTISTETVQEAKINLMGDVTGDGQIKLADYLKVLGHTKGTELTGYEYDCADVTGDGNVKLADYLKILAHTKGESTLF